MQIPEFKHSHTWPFLFTHIPDHWTLALSDHDFRERLLSPCKKVTSNSHSVSTSYYHIVYDSSMHLKTSCTLMPHLLHLKTYFTRIPFVSKVWLSHETNYFNSMTLRSEKDYPLSAKYRPAGSRALGAPAHSSCSDSATKLARVGVSEVIGARRHERGNRGA
jgi:hypothetical protein